MRLTHIPGQAGRDLFVVIITTTLRTHHQHHIRAVRFRLTRLCRLALARMKEELIIRPPDAVTALRPFRVQCRNRIHANSRHPERSVRVGSGRLLALYQRTHNQFRDTQLLFVIRQILRTHARIDRSIRSRRRPRRDISTTTRHDSSNQ